MARHLFLQYVGMTEAAWMKQGCPIEGMPFADDVGSFEIFSLRALKTGLTDGGVKSTARPLTVRIRGDYANNDLFDTSAMQTRAGPQTMFQIASNMDCLERPHCDTSLDDGFCCNVMEDDTQGPAGAGGAWAGMFGRVARCKREGINLLTNTGIPVRNGKIMPGKFPKIDVDDVCVGLQTDVRARYDRTCAPIKVVPDGPRIDQVYTSTVAQISKTPTALAEKLLAAAYAGTYLCAIRRRTKTLVLTVIGGGCFQNNYAQIAKALGDAHVKYSPYMAEGSEVILPLYAPNDDFYTFIKAPHTVSKY